MNKIFKRLVLRSLDLENHKYFLNIKRLILKVKIINLNQKLLFLDEKLPISIKNCRFRSKTANLGRRKILKKILKNLKRFWKDNFSIQDLRNHKYFLNMKNLIFYVLHIMYYESAFQNVPCGNRSMRRFLTILRVQ